MEARRLAGRVAVVTGAAQGIGEGIARRLAAEGASVVIADIDEALARRTAESITGEHGGDAAVVQRVDVSDEDSVKALAAAVGARFRRCDILVNNAAILDATPYDGLTMDRLRKVLDINLHGAMICTMQLVPLMRANRWGRIVNIASIMGLRGSRDSIAYSTAKGGMVNLTRSLACDLARDGILVNAVAPGFIDTRMALLPDGSGHEHETDWFKDIYIKYGRIPLGRAGLPDDIAGAAYFLCSDDCKYVTGQILLVDGGLSATF
jgi:NAD(P)-dependent dehydrogenase (short-subunit alcohol dehydrogenase family)